MEVELKLLLASDEEAGRLRPLLGRHLHTLTQTNVYFTDPAGRWREARWSARLRRIAERVVLTIKGPPRRRGDFVERGEWEAELSSASWDALAAGEQSLAAAVARLLTDEQLELPPGLDPAELRPFATSDTVREVYAYPQEGGAAPLHFELDRTRYPDGSSDLELELEAPADASPQALEQMLKAKLGEAHIPWRVATQSKLGRTLAAIDRMQQRQAPAGDADLKLPAQAKPGRDNADVHPCVSPEGSLSLE